MDLKKLFLRKPVLTRRTPRSERDPDGAELLVRQGRHAEAVSLHLATADDHVAADRYELAVRLVRRALEIDPEHMEAAERLNRWEHVRATLSRRDRILELLALRLAPGAGSHVTPREVRQHWPGIAGSPLLADLSDEELTGLFASMDVQRWGDRFTLCRQGQHQAQCYWIVDGTIEAITMTSTGDSRVLLLFGPGDLIGESLVLNDTSLQATYKTSGAETTALRLTKRGLDEALKDSRQSVLDALGRHGRDREVSALLG